MALNKMVSVLTQENPSLGFANNKSTDQPVHPQSLIRAFIICFLKSTISSTCFMQTFNFLASLCSRGDWFESRYVGNPEDRFCFPVSRTICLKLMDKKIFFFFCISGPMDQYILCGYAVLCKLRNDVPCLDLVTG